MRVTTGLAAVLAAALTTGLAGCVLGGELKTENQSQVYDERVTRVEVQLDAGDVSFSPAADDTVSVSRRLMWRSEKPVVTEAFDAGTMRISVRCPSLGTCEVDFRLKVPAASSVHVRTDSGDISLTGITGGLDLGTDSGDIAMVGAAGTVRVAVDSGEVKGSGLRSGDVLAKVDSGEITLAFAAPPATVDAQSQSGDVTVAVPRADGGYRVQAETDSGRRTVTVDDTPAGGRTIVALADSGDVTVRH